MNGLVAGWELRIGRQVFTVEVSDHLCTSREGAAVSPHTVLTIPPNVWLAIDEGELSGFQAFLDRKLRVEGNLDLAVRLQTMFRPSGRRRREADLDQVDVQVGDVVLSSYLLGHGEPLVLLHGLGGSKISWLPLLAPLAQNYRLVVPDLPGHGESAKPRTDYTPRYYARVVRQLMDRLEIDRTALVGNSMGGRVALEMALRSPGRVTALALLGPAVPGFRWRYLAGFTRIVPTEFGALPIPLRERWMTVALHRLFSQPGRLGPEAFSVAAKEFIRVYRDPRARMAFFSSLRHVVTEHPQPFFAGLRRIKQRCLVIVGQDDRLVPVRLGMRLYEGLPNAELILMPGVGHVPQFENPEETLAAIRDFLAGREGAA
jgi:pimeloyl-ACP methyl ester carboxylesterase